MRSILFEAKKHLSFREPWVGYILGLGYLLLSLYVTKETIPDIGQRWCSMYQNIYSYGATLSAFLVVVCISRLMCYEQEQKTDALLYTAANGRNITFWSKIGFTAIFCALIVVIIGCVSIIFHGSSFGFEGAFSPITECLYFRLEGCPAISKLAYCIFQYFLLYLGVLYFAGFVMIVATLTKRTALTICISGGAYLALLIHYLAGSRLLRGTALAIANTVWRFSFAGFMLQESYSWTSIPNLPGEWSNVWKPILLVICIVLAECILLWQLWRKKDCK